MDATDSTPEETLTGSGKAMGTVDYMPPEQAENTKLADQRADIYSLGCTLYYLLTGHTIYRRETVVARLLAHREDAIPSLRDERDDVPERLDHVYQKMVAKRREDRHGSMAEVIGELEACAAANLNQVEATASFEAAPPIRISVRAEETMPAEAAETPADESLPLDLPVISPVEDFIRTHRKSGYGPLIPGAIAAAIGFLVVVFFLGVILRVRTPEGTLVLEINQPHATVEILDDRGQVEVTRKNNAGRISVAVDPGKHRLKVRKGDFHTFTREFTLASGQTETIRVWLEPLATREDEPFAPIPPPPSPAAPPSPPPPPEWAFSEPVNLGPTVNSSSTDAAPTLSADGQTLLFCSERAGGHGEWDLWMCTRAPPFAVAPFDGEEAKEHQQAWADFLGVPVEWEDPMGMSFVLIPPGEFTMGSPEVERQWALEEAKAAGDRWAIERIPTELPHRVKITRPFYLGKCEVTQAQWEAVMGSNPSQFKAPTNPVETVSWDDIQPFLANLNVAGTRRVPSAKTALAVYELQYALPTEAQWEYACRAGTTTAFCFGDDPAMLVDYAWFSGNAGDKTHPVGQRKPNAWGLHDMHGNVWEWCADWWAADHVSGRAMPDRVARSGSNRVLRGGYYDYNAGGCRSAHRIYFSPGYKDFGIGFRLALVLVDQ